MKEDVNNHCLSRRHFMALSAATGTAAMTGCAINPVTGKWQYMIVSEAAEVNIDRKNAPHQFSSDYGAVQDPELNEYINTLGKEMSAVTHRPNMPYNFRAVNSVVVNGYTLPAGSVALARGLMLSFNDESEMASVVGHELGHVNRRHAGERMSKTLTAQVLVAAMTAAVAEEYEEYTALAAGLGGVGATLLLSRYSRDDEREADAHGMEYCARSEINPKGMIGVMKMFQELHKTKPSVVDLLFSTHPMSEERYQTAIRRLDAEYKHTANYPVNRERFMDKTSRLRKIRGAVEDMQKGQECLMIKKYNEAETHLHSALKQAPSDYAGLLLMSKCYLVQEKYNKANRYAEMAKAVYPQEAQARHVSGMVKLNQSKFDVALAEFQSYEKILPGNANTVFYEGFCLDRMGRKPDAAKQYKRYLGVAPAGEFAKPVTQRMIEWGYIKPPPKPTPKPEA